MKPFSLPNFEGPLELLVHLIQSEEIDILEIQLKALTEQFTKKEMLHQMGDFGADFLAYTSWLLLFKSKRLLPEAKRPEEEETPLYVEIMEHLLEYCKFKEVASSLTQKEEEARDFFSRGVTVEPKKNLSQDALKIDELGFILQQLIEKAPKAALVKNIEEEWPLAPKILFLKEKVEKECRVSFYEIFSSEKSKNELIVFFLALLELMKDQAVLVIKSEETYWIQKIC